MAQGWALYDSTGIYCLNTQIVRLAYGLRGRCRFLSGTDLHRMVLLRFHWSTPLAKTATTLWCARDCKTLQKVLRQKHWLNHDPLCQKLLPCRWLPANSRKQSPKRAGMYQPWDSVWHRDEQHEIQCMCVACMHSCHSCLLLSCHHVFCLGSALVFHLYTFACR